MKNILKQYHYLYKITNLINNKIYIGIHSADNLDDGYFGSGKSLHQAFKKYGKENFKKEILEWFDWKCEALNRESQIVNEEFIKRNDVYNLKSGGDQYISLSKESKLKISSSLKGFKHSEETLIKFRNRNNKTMLGKRHSIASKLKMQVNNKTSIGNKHHNFGGYGTRLSPCIFQGLYFERIKDVSICFNKSMKWVRRRLNSNLFEDCFKIN